MPVTPLPLELCVFVAQHLPNSDIKSLRLVCKDFWGKFHLRLDRVFLSANPLNIQVFRSIAAHKTFRHGIVEIIWDDARLKGDMDRHEQRALEDNLSDPGDISGDQYCSDSDDAAAMDAERPADNSPRWYKILCYRSISDLKRRSRRGCNRPATQARLRELEGQLSSSESWKYYKHLLEQQQQVLVSGADAEALRYGLTRFPALRRLIVTPTGHGFLFGSFYQTPMIRAFPYGFVYPVPIAWPTQEDFELPPWVKPWDDSQRQIWRGVCITLQELAKQEHNVVEFLIQPNGHRTGLNCRMFDQPCQEYDSFKKLLGCPGFRYLELSVLADEEDDDWSALTNGRLSEALSEAMDLEHLDFRFQIDADQEIDLERIPPLRSMLPFDRWPKLQHFGLARALVRHEELISVLQNLPPTVRSVELSELHFFDERPNPVHSRRRLLRRMREDLDWRTRLPKDRPRIGFNTGAYEGMTRQDCFDVEVASFVYGEGPNPFDEPEVEAVAAPNVIVGYAQDPLEPDYTMGHLTVG
ncbi:hypothetical protein G7054_g9038 [Neopestalotiopsis clavispora]|nr:hypothetical protein G7054_g9038 [Neopestalotiopsis clavispora]